MGSGQIFGIVLPENFKRPFFSSSISEFWKRWHISLGAWFRDYMFYPISMSKPLKKLTMKSRKRLGNHFGPLLAGAVALLCVWLCNGFWHGAGWQYIFFGLYHFILILCGNAFEPYSEKALKKLHIDPNCKVYYGFRVFKTTLLVCIGELFFRAATLSAGMGMFGKIFSDFSFATLKSGAILKTLSASTTLPRLMVLRSRGRCRSLPITMAGVWTSATTTTATTPRRWLLQVTMHR